MVLIQTTSCNRRVSYPSHLCKASSTDYFWRKPAKEAHLGRIGLCRRSRAIWSTFLSCSWATWGRYWESRWSRNTRNRHRASQCRLNTAQSTGQPGTFDDSVSEIREIVKLFLITKTLLRAKVTPFSRRFSSKPLRKESLYYYLGNKFSINMSDCLFID